MKQQHEKINTVLFYQVCADTVKANQSRAQHNMGAGYAFFAHQTSWPLTFWPWKWCPSPLWRVKRRFRVVVSINFIFPRPLCFRLRPDMRDRRTSDVRRASLLNASAIWGRCIIIVIVLLNAQLGVTVIEVTAFRLLKCTAQEHSERLFVGLRTTIFS